MALAAASCGSQKETSAAEDAAENAHEAEQGAPAGGDAETLADIAAKNLIATQKFLEDNAKNEGVKVTGSGLQYLVLEEGAADGVTPVSTDIVVVEYVSRMKDGLELDSSHARGAAAKFPLNRVIPAWTEGIQLMSEGDKFRFFTPPALAFGETGMPGSPIGPNEALVFDIELLKVESPARNLEEANKFLAENAGKDGVNTTASGLQYEVISEGPAGGASPKATDVVKVHYQGTFINGTEFDSSYKKGRPSEFPLNGVIAAWTEGLQLMSVGDKYRFFVPPALGYGEYGGGSVGPNQAMIFEVELIEVK